MTLIVLPSSLGPLLGQILLYCPRGGPHYFIMLFELLCVLFIIVGTYFLFRGFRYIHIVGNLRSCDIELKNVREEPRTFGTELGGGSAMG